MEINPYDPPTRDASVAQDLVGDPPRRPIGVWLLSILYFLSGILLGFLGIGLYQLNSQGDMPSSSAIPFHFLLAAGLSMAVVFLITAVGIWLAARWSWWLTCFFQVFGIVGSTSVLAIVVAKAASFGLEHLIPVFVKHGVRLGFHGTLLWYMLRPNVMRFFALEGLRKPRALAIILVVSVVLFALLAGVLFYRAAAFSS